jgi:hypothetical protein
MTIHDRLTPETHYIAADRGLMARRVSAPSWDWNHRRGFVIRRAARCAPRTESSIVVDGARPAPRGGWRLIRGVRAAARRWHDGANRTEGTPDRRQSCGETPRAVAFFGARFCDGI